MKEHLLARLGVIERVTPSLLNTLSQIQAHTKACLEDEGCTLGDWQSWDLAEREAFLVRWRKRHGRKHPNVWPPVRAEWL